MTKKRKILACDFDGVISDYSKGYQGKGVFGKVIEGAGEFLQKIHEDGWLIVIWTGRDEVGLVKKYLEANKIPYDYINENPENPMQSDSPKLFATVYLDDRAVTFHGDWKKSYYDIKDFQSWEGREHN